ncbi:MAG TPA: DinB family protein [Chitinophagales bacterium]|nr:DinB family protein [Chitinophagales bacterium]
MNPTLQAQFNDIESSRKALFSYLAKYPDEVLNKQPAPGSWSAVQVIEHLLSSEEASLKYLQKKTLDTSKAQKAGLAGKWRLLKTKLVFAVPLKFKAPEALAPDNAFVKLADLEQRYNNVRSATIQLLGKLSDSELEKELWKNIISGKMNVYQMLEFFGFHFDRHRAQIERAVKQVQ